MIFQKKKTDQEVSDKTEQKLFTGNQKKEF